MKCDLYFVTAVFIHTLSLTHLTWHHITLVQLHMGNEAMETSHGCLPLIFNMALHTLDVCVRGFIHVTGMTYIPVRVHSGSLLLLCICLHDTSTKSHTRTSHINASSPRPLYWSETFTSLRKLVPMSCKHDTIVCFGMKSISQGSGMGGACMCLFNHTSANI